jgi:signal transduction histidine kinase
VSTSGVRPFLRSRSADGGIVLSADPQRVEVPYSDPQMIDTVRSLWAQTRAPDPSGPAARDWALVAVVVVIAGGEAASRPDLVWRPFSLCLTVALAATLPWRRVHPLGVVAIAFGAVGVADLVALVRDVEWDGLDTAAFLLLLPYSLTRWGSGREVAGGLAIIAVPIVSTALDGAPAGDVVGGTLVVLLAATLGALIRNQQASHAQELAGVRSRERVELARELHDTVAHHVSAIAVRAQAGRVLAVSEPAAAADALVVIEEEASRALEEMRAMIGALRQSGDGQSDLAPQQGIRDIERLTSATGPGPRIDVEMVGDLADLRPSVDAAGYRIAQEAITNALRHARHVTLIRVEVAGERDCVRLTVDDDGRGGAGGMATSGFGLVGMAERAKLLGGVLEAGPRADGGWTVRAALPRHGAPP